MTDVFSTTTTRHHNYHYLWLLPSILLVVVVLAWVSTSVLHSSRNSISSSQGPHEPLALHHRSQGNQRDVTIQDITNSSEMLQGDDEHHNITEHSVAWGSCECLPPYKQVLHQCFYANPNHHLDWVTAARFCEGMEGYLARPTHIPALIAFLLEHHPNVMRWYLGGSDLAEEGVWLWTDGRPVSNEDWIPSEPNGNTHENCLELCFANCERNRKSFLTFPALNDESCKTSLNFVCEFSTGSCVEVW